MKKLLPKELLKGEPLLVLKKLKIKWLRINWELVTILMIATP
jgi:hypothetical protein